MEKELKSFGALTPPLEKRQGLKDKPTESSNLNQTTSTSIKDDIKEDIRAVLNDMLTDMYYDDIMEEIELVIDEHITLPHVPKFVADWYEEQTKGKLKDAFLGCRILDVIKGVDNNPNLYEFENWLTMNEDSISILFLMRYGYTTDEEPLYYVKFVEFDECTYLNVHKNGSQRCDNKIEADSWKTKFTESEIKNINPNYLHFKIPVDEVDKEEGE